MKKSIVFILIMTIIMISSVSVMAAPKSPEICITGYKTDQEIISPGSTFKITLDLKNNGEYNARKIKITLNNEQGQENLGDFSPIKQSNVQYISALNAGKSKDMSFNLYVSPKIEPGNYNIIIKLSYKDNNGVSYEEVQTIGILVKEKDSVILIGDENLGEIIPGQPIESEMQIVNNGIAEVKGVSTSLQGEGQDSQVEYFGNFNGGDYDVYTYTITPGDKSGENTATIQVEYTNSLNEPQKVEKTITYKITDNGGSKDSENQKESGNWFINFIKGIFGIS